MTEKNEVQVIIDGKVLTMCGFESNEYLQRIANFVNDMIGEYNKVDSFRRQPLDLQNVLLQINLADDYFKAQKQIDTIMRSEKNQSNQISMHG